MISEQALDILKTLSGAILDAYVLVDRKERILEFNQVFFGLFPRNVARGLKKKPLDKVLAFKVGQEPQDLVEQCMAKAKPVRYDEVMATLSAEQTSKMVVAAVPLFDDRQEVTGAFICLRDITGDTHVQTKYRQMLDQDAQEREHLEQRIQASEAEVLQVKDRLNAVEKELLDYRKGLLI